MAVSGLYLRPLTPASPLSQLSGGTSFDLPTVPVTDYSILPPPRAAQKAVAQTIHLNNFFILRIFNPISS